MYRDASRDSVGRTDAAALDASRTLVSNGLLLNWSLAYAFCVFSNATRTESRPPSAPEAPAPPAATVAVDSANAAAVADPNVGVCVCTGSAMLLVVGAAAPDPPPPLLTFALMRVEARELALEIVCRLLLWMADAPTIEDRGLRTSVALYCVRPDLIDGATLEKIGHCAIQHAVHHIAQRAAQQQPTNRHQQPHTASLQEPLTPPRSPLRVEELHLPLPLPLPPAPAQHGRVSVRAAWEKPALWRR
jgi:hypothetical protein